MAKAGYILLAEHFGTDSETIRDLQYQAGKFNKPVYSLSDNEFWSGGKIKPVDHNGIITGWAKVISSYDKKSILWRTQSGAV